MNAVDILTKKLTGIVALENDRSIETLGGYIVGELLGDYDNVYAGLAEKNPIVQRIGELASDIEISNGNPEELQEMWSELKKLVKKLHSNDK